MFEKYSTSSAYFWGSTSAIGGAISLFFHSFTLDQWVVGIGITCTVATCLINWYYKRKDYKLKERHFENTEKDIDGNGW